MEFCVCQSSQSKMAHSSKHSASSYRSSDSEHYFIHKRRRSNRGGQSDVSKLPPAIQVELVNSSCPKIQSQNCPNDKTDPTKIGLIFLYNSKDNFQTDLSRISNVNTFGCKTTNIFSINVQATVRHVKDLDVNGKKMLVISDFLTFYIQNN